MHFLLCNNRLIETSQLSSRMNQEFPNANCVIFSSAKDSKIKTRSEMVEYLMDNESCNKIIACTNATRLKDFEEFFEKIYF